MICHSPSLPWLQHHPGGQEALGVPVERQEVTLSRSGSKFSLYFLPGSGYFRVPSHPHSPVTYHGTRGPSLACGSWTALLTLSTRKYIQGQKDYPYITHLWPSSSPPDTPHCHSPLSPGDPGDHQGQAFPLGLRDPQGQSFLGPPQHQGPPETHRKNLSPKAEGGDKGGLRGPGWGTATRAEGSAWKRWTEGMCVETEA